MSANSVNPPSSSSAHAHPQTIPTCDSASPLEPEHVAELKHEIVSIEKAQRMGEFFSVLGDANRWRILSALAVQGMRVRDLADIVEMSESAVSHQLRVLRSMRLVSYRKRGRNVFYCLKDDHILNLYREVSEHLDEPDDAE
ncbi:MAG: ArsR/SmtB family transcription factor [Elainellaceae cyanobacterium]